MHISAADCGVSVVHKGEDQPSHAGCAVAPAAPPVRGVTCDACVCSQSASPSPWNSPGTCANRIQARTRRDSSSETRCVQPAGLSTCREDPHPHQRAASHLAWSQCFPCAGDETATVEICQSGTSGDGERGVLRGGGQGGGWTADRPPTTRRPCGPPRAVGSCARGSRLRCVALLTRTPSKYKAHTQHSQWLYSQCEHTSTS